MKLAKVSEIHAVLVDVGGVFFVPHADPVAEALQKVGLEVDPLAVERAHYCGIAAVDAKAGVGEIPMSTSGRMLPRSGFLPRETGTQPRSSWGCGTHERRTCGGKPWGEQWTA